MTSNLCQGSAIIFFSPLKAHEDCHQSTIAIKKITSKMKLMSLVTSQVVYPDQVTKNFFKRVWAPSVDFVVQSYTTFMDIFSINNPCKDMNPKVGQKVPNSTTTWDLFEVTFSRVNQRRRDT